MNEQQKKQKMDREILEYITNRADKQIKVAQEQTQHDEQEAVISKISNAYSQTFEINQLCGKSPEEAKIEALKVAQCIQTRLIDEHDNVMGPKIHTDDWVDALQRFGKEDCPTEDEIDNAKFVKLCSSKPERFWVEVVSKFDDVIIGKVSNKLCCKRDYDIDDYVSFKKENVYDTRKPEPEPKPEPKKRGRGRPRKQNIN
jgi:hypothetical protein